MSLEELLIQSYVVFGLGMIVYVGKQLLNPYFEKQNAKNTLISDLKLLFALQTESKYVFYPLDNWNSIQKTGVLNDFNKEVQVKLLSIYSRVMNKNNIVELWKQELLNSMSKGKMTPPVLIYFGEKGETLNNVLELQKESIVTLVTEVLKEIS
jgi:hypothetical protein